MSLPELVTRPATIDHETVGSALFGLGSALPDRVVDDAEISELVGVEPGWIPRRTGIAARRWAAPGDRLQDLAARAAERAIADAGLQAVDLDLILVATCTADELIPSASALVAAEIGATRAGAIDVGAACTGFVSALSLAAGLIESGRAERVLVVGAEILSRHIDTGDRNTAALFGDGAGAIVLGASAKTAVAPVVLGADGAQGHLLRAARADGLIRMDGPEVFRHAVARMGQASLDACERAGTDLLDLDLLVFHQANARILGALIERHGLNPERVVNAIEQHGNTSAASIPLTLDVARRDGRLPDGARVLLAAFGAGFTWGATVVQWGDPDAT